LCLCGSIFVWSMTNSFSGFLNINKPQGVTSHDVVAQIRRGLKQRGMGAVKVGHAGTLDPMATGVLILCLGAATRLSDDVMHGEKQYRATLKFGEATDTYDAEGQVMQTRDASSLTRTQIEAALPAFTGDILQVPPMYSAIKQGGKKLYDLARQGQTVEREPRAVTIRALQIVSWDAPFLVLDVTCSAGTYIRSLAYDLGEILNVGAHLTGLIRTASGAFTLENAITPESLQDAADWSPLLTPMQTALPHLPTIAITLDQARELRFGRALAYDGSGIERGVAILPSGELVAVLKRLNDVWQPEKVFSAES
jgi:tRNA pseudouridine55 synthase